MLGPVVPVLVDIGEVPVDVSTEFVETDDPEDVCTELVDCEEGGGVDWELDGLGEVLPMELPVD